MKIAIVAPEDLPIPPTRGGSVQIYVHALARALTEVEGVQLVLISPKRGRSHDSDNQETKFNAQHLRLNASTPKAYQKAVLSALSALQPDLIQVENRPLLAAAVKRRLRRPTLLNLHSVTFLGPAHTTAQQAATALRAVDGVVCNSRYLRRAIVRRFALQADRQRFHVIFPGIDLERFKYQRRTVTKFSRNRPLRILFVGRVIRQKGVLVLIRSIRQLHEAGHPVHLTLVGRTPPWEKNYGSLVRREARSCPVQWVGFVSPQGLPGYYRRHDVFVCPSQDKEAFGLVNLEALATGLPVIASRVGGIPEAVTDDTGILVDHPQRPESFRRAIESCLAHPERLASWSEMGRRHAQEFSWERTARDFVKLYQKVNGR